MCNKKRHVAILTILALFVSFAIPRPAEAIIPGIAAAAAALGCSEGTLVAVGGGLLAAGGIVAAGESERVKVVAAAVAGLGSAALERLSAAVNAVGPGGQFTLPIDTLLASTIGEMVDNVEWAAESGEEIEYQIPGNEEVGSLPFPDIDLGGGEGILVTVTDWYVTGDASSEMWIFVKGHNRVNEFWSGIYLWTGSSDKSLSESHQHEKFLKYAIYQNGSKVAEGEITRLLCGTTGSYIWNTGQHSLGEHTAGAAVIDGNCQLYIDGTEVWTIEGVGSEYGLQEIQSAGSVNYPNPFMYSIDSMGVDVLTPGIDYTNAGLTAEQIAALAGTTITGDVVTNVYNPPAINPPVTWPEATDLTGVIGALQNVWNAINQGFTSLKTAVTSLPNTIVTGITNAFIPDVEVIEGMATSMRDTLQDHAPFSWFSDWTGAGDQDYGSSPIILGWQIGLDPAERIEVELEGNSLMRNISTLAISIIAVWAVYFEIRRFVG